MNRNKWFAVAVAVVLVLAVGWYLASPAYALSQLKDAAESGEADELAERIDFPRVKESLKTQFKAKMAAEVAKDDDNPFGAMGSMIAMAMIDPMIDGLVTAEGMSAMIQEGKLQREEAGATQPEPVEWVVERDGLNRFVAMPEDQRDEKTGLVFERDGLSWVLVDLDLPDDLPTAD